MRCLLRYRNDSTTARDEGTLLRFLSEQQAFLEVADGLGDGQGGFLTETAGSVRPTWYP